MAKSNIILDVKPWDDETGKSRTWWALFGIEGPLWNVTCVCFVVCADMKEIEAAVRSVQADGLLWGACKY